MSGMSRLSVEAMMDEYEASGELENLYDRDQEKNKNYQPIHKKLLEQGRLGWPEAQAEKSNSEDSSSSDSK